MVDVLATLGALVTFAAGVKAHRDIWPGIASTRQRWSAARRREAAWSGATVSLTATTSRSVHSRMSRCIITPADGHVAPDDARIHLEPGTGLHWTVDDRFVRYERVDDIGGLDSDHLECVTDIPAGTPVVVLAASTEPGGEARSVAGWYRVGAGTTPAAIPPPRAPRRWPLGLFYVPSVVLALLASIVDFHHGIRVISVAAVGLWWIRDLRNGMVGWCEPPATGVTPD